MSASSSNSRQQTPGERRVKLLLRNPDGTTLRGTLSIRRVSRKAVWRGTANLGNEPQTVTIRRLRSTDPLGFDLPDPLRIGYWSLELEEMGVTLSWGSAWGLGPNTQGWKWKNAGEVIDALKGT